MNSNQISNPKTEVSQGIELNDKDYITSLLTCLKDMEKNYTIAMTEASCEKLHNEYNNIFTQIAELQRLTYETMFKNGWYTLEKAENTKINTKFQMLLQEYQDLNIEQNPK